jgi:signal transduction histidine kinase
MKSLIKILSRYLSSAVLVALILVILNFAIMILWMFETRKNTIVDYPTEQVADQLYFENGQYQFSELGREALQEKYQWAMLISNEGNILWGQNLPEDVPQTYTLSDVASMSRWYLEDYPVNVWRRDDGLFILGYPKDSLWKMHTELPLDGINRLIYLIPIGILLNIIAALILTFIFGSRLFKSLRILLTGVKKLEQNQAIDLPTNGILGDLAENLNRTSATLQAQQEALQKRDQARSTWIAGVSHDIRTPLSMVMGYASQLEENMQLPEEQRQRAAVIRQQSWKIKTLISDLNLASKLEYSMQALHIEPYSPTVLIRESVTELINRGANKQHPITVQIHPNAEPCVLEGDEKLLARALTNLLENSIRHNPQGCAIHIAAENNDTHLSITVQDNGNGFPDAVLASVKLPLTPESLDTHGLGLLIVRQIVAAHQGQVSFENLKEGGSLVRVELPFA